MLSNEFRREQRQNVLISILTNSSSQMLYEKVSWRRADAELITMATDVDLRDVGYTEQTDQISSLANNNVDSQS